VSVRGTDRRNPVLPYIHGGPGYVSIPMSWWFSCGLEEYFTVVQWDQRAAGKTYSSPILPRSRGPSQPNGWSNDVDVMAAWARHEFDKDRILVLGHSYGGFLGLRFAQHHPERLYAYIGVCQSINGPENERGGRRFAVDAAGRAGNSEAMRELEAIAPYAAPGQTIPIKDLYVQRKWVGYLEA